MTDTYSAIQAAMLNDVNRMAIISQNMANASTSGYKKQIAISTSFTDYLSSYSTGAENNSQVQFTKFAVPHIDNKTDPSMGSVKFTGNSLDLIAEGNTYFTILTPNGIAYTKQGSFNKSANGTIVNALGYPLLGESGAINLSTANPRIDEFGNVYEADKLIAKLNTVSIKPEAKLIGMGFGMYTSESLLDNDPDTRVNIKQGYLEMSNVVVMDEMVKLIETMRHFEASQKFMMGYDDMLDNAINIIGDL